MFDTIQTTARLWYLPYDITIRSANGALSITKHRDEAKIVKSSNRNKGVADLRGVQHLGKCELAAICAVWEVNG
jgi:hypothetical protein